MRNSVTFGIRIVYRIQSTQTELARRECGYCYTVNRKMSCDLQLKVSLCSTPETPYSTHIFKIIKSAEKFGPAYLEKL